MLQITNNALVLTQHRFIFAQIGDESSSCNGEDRTTTRKPAWGNPCSFFGDCKYLTTTFKTGK